MLMPPEPDQPSPSTPLTSPRLMAYDVPKGSWLPPSIPPRSLPMGTTPHQLGAPAHCTHFRWNEIGRRQRTEDGEGQGGSFENVSVPPSSPLVPKSHRHSEGLVKAYARLGNKAAANATTALSASAQASPASGFPAPKLHGQCRLTGL